MSTFTVFPGNCPRNVSKDAKYGIRGTDGRVGLTYCTADDERWHLTTKAHPELADMVNDIKRTLGSGPKGPFYINAKARFASSTLNRSMNPLAHSHQVSGNARNTA